MLQGIRDRAQSWFMWVIVVLIIVPFALWGIHQYFGPALDQPVAQVGDRSITVREFQQSLQAQRYRLQSSLGAAGLDLDEAAERRLKQETLNRMVAEEVLVAAATGHGMTVSDEQLAVLIHSLDLFRVNGQFSREQYERWVRSQGYLPGGFEESFRRSVLVNQVQAGLSSSAFTTSPELDRLARLRGQTRSFSYLVVPLSRFEDKVEVSGEAVERYYRENAQQFMQPEEVSIEYVQVSREAIATGIEVPEEDVRQRYDASKGAHTVPEQRRARHILLGLSEEADPQTVEAVLARARELRDRIVAGASFEELARAQSEDPGSAQQGGDLGFFSQGTMVGPFENAVFSMQPAAVSEPVRTSFGVHIIRLEEVRPGSVRPFEEVREDLRREIQFERAEALFFEQVERIANLAFEHPDSLEPVAEAVGLKVESTGFFSHAGGPGLAAERKVVDAAFSDEVRRQGHNSEPIELPGNRVLVLRERESRPAAQRTLDEVRAEVVARLKAEAARARVAALAREMVAALEAGKGDPAQVASAEGLAWSDAKDIGRSAASPDPAIVRVAFRMPRPTGGARSYTIAELADGSMAVVSLEAVSDGGTVDATERPALQRRVSQAYGQALFDATVETLREGTAIEVFSDRL
jgi:peptidyl-prolyl cis-trans isomerase D